MSVTWLLPNKSGLAMWEVSETQSFLRLRIKINMQKKKKHKYEKLENLSILNSSLELLSYLKSS